MTHPADLEALLRSFEEAIPDVGELTKETQAQNRARLDQLEALAAAQAETLFRAHLEALKAAHSARDVGQGLDALSEDMEAVVKRARAELLAQLQQATGPQDE